MLDVHRIGAAAPREASTEDGGGKEAAVRVARLEVALGGASGTPWVSLSTCRWMAEMRKVDK
jgi:hypothetical protein